MGLILLSLANQNWLDDFIAKHKRVPRILHIGNIANNAYNNAKIMRQAGLASDVICHDYYHIMACPEWEDADFDGGQYGDDFKPAWHAAKIKNFKRPEWFVQGALVDCQNYLLAKQANDQLEMARLWAKLSTQNGLSESRQSDHYSQTIKRYLGINRLRLRLSELKRFLYQSYLALQRRGRILLQSDNGTKRIAGLLLKTGLAGLWAGYKTCSIARSVVTRYGTAVATGEYASIHENTVERQFFDSRTRAFSSQYRDEFPDRTNRLAQNEMEFFRNSIPKWRRVLNNYDIVIGYATLSVIPLICDKAYLAFEHGTLRDIPYTDDKQGKLTALCYRMAKHVFVTNFDCVKSAEFLAPNRFTTINHPYDEDHGNHIIGDKALRKSLKKELASEFLFFHPTRQDWIEGKGFADKGNDVFINAFISLRKTGHKVGLVCCNWGQNVRQTQALLNQAGCMAYVKWISPLAITPFERMCLASDIVVDQFKLGAFGGVLFKALSVGAPILTYLDEKAVVEQYSQCPPVINCKTETEIRERVEKLINQPELLKEIGANGRSWIEKHHAKEITVNKQVDQFRRLCKP